MVARLFFIWLSLIYCRCDWSFCSGPGCYAEIAQRPSMSVLSNTFATDSRQFFLELNGLTVRNLVMWNANGTLTACLCNTRFLFWICGILPSSAGLNSPGIQQSGFWCRNCVCAHCFFLPLDPNWKRTWRQCSKEVSELISLRRFIYFISPVCYFCVFFCLIPWSNHWRSSQRHSAPAHTVPIRFWKQCTSICGKSQQSSSLGLRTWPEELEVSKIQVPWWDVCLCCRQLFCKASSWESCVCLWEGDRDGFDCSFQRYWHGPHGTSSPAGGRSWKGACVARSSCSPPCTVPCVCGVSRLQMLNVATLVEELHVFCNCWGRKDNNLNIFEPTMHFCISKLIPDYHRKNQTLYMSSFAFITFLLIPLNNVEVFLWTHWIIPTWHLQCRRRHQPSAGCSQSPHSRRPLDWLVWPRQRHRFWSGSHPDTGLEQISSSAKKICETTLGWWKGC